VTPYEVIRDAILCKKTITATCDGHPRVMCPHVIGRNKSGEEQALFYQYGGTSSRGLGPDGSPRNWRCIKIARLKNVRSEEGPWHTAPDHLHPQSCVAAIDVDVALTL
jgi:hypothetical protein